jgi:hypothetical protein
MKHLCAAGKYIKNSRALNEKTWIITRQLNKTEDHFDQLDPILPELLIEFFGKFKKINISERTNPFIRSINQDYIISLITTIIHRVKIPVNLQLHWTPFKSQYMFINDRMTLFVLRGFLMETLPQSVLVDNIPLLEFFDRRSFNVVSAIEGTIESPNCPLTDIFDLVTNPLISRACITLEKMEEQFDSLNEELVTQFDSICENCDLTINPFFGKYERQTTDCTNLTFLEFACYLYCIKKRTIGENQPNSDVDIGKLLLGENSKKKIKHN